MVPDGLMAVSGRALKGCCDDWLHGLDAGHPRSQRFKQGKPTAIICTIFPVRRVLRYAVKSSRAAGVVHVLAKDSEFHAMNNASIQCDQYFACFWSAFLLNETWPHLEEDSDRPCYFCLTAGRKVKTSTRRCTVHKWMRQMATPESRCDLVKVRELMQWPVRELMQWPVRERRAAQLSHRQRPHEQRAVRAREAHG
jgi:hypothetical protein